MDNEVTNGSGGKVEGLHPIAGVRLPAVDRARVAARVQELGLIVPDDPTLEQLVVALSAHMSGVTPAWHRVDCNKCLGPGDERDDSCDFCGHDDARPLYADDKRKKLLAEHNAREALRASEEAEKKGKRKKPEPKVEVVKDIPTAALAVKAPAKVAKSEPKRQSEKDLDKAVADIHELQRAGQNAYYKLARYLHEHIFLKDLWRLRTDPEDPGKRKWRRVDDFVRGELGMKPQAAWQAMKIAQAYTEEDVVRFGPTKLMLTLQAPKALQEELRAKLEGGDFTSKDLKKEVVEANKKERETGEVAPRWNPTGKLSGGARSGAGRPAKGEPKITVAAILGTVRVLLHAKPKKLYPGTDLEKIPRAKSLRDIPFGREELPNGVVRTYWLQEDAGGELLLKIETERPTEEAVEE